MPGGERDLRCIGCNPDREAKHTCRIAGISACPKFMEIGCQILVRVRVGAGYCRVTQFFPAEEGKPPGIERDI